MSKEGQSVYNSERKKALTRLFKGLNLEKKAYTSQREIDMSMEAAEEILRDSSSAAELQSLTEAPSSESSSS